MKYVQNGDSRLSTIETAGKKKGYCWNLILMCKVTSAWRLLKHSQCDWTRKSWVSPSAISNTAVTADIMKGCRTYGDSQSYTIMYRHRSRHLAKPDAEISNFSRRRVLKHKQLFLHFLYKIMIWYIYILTIKRTVTIYPEFHRVIKHSITKLSALWMQ